MPRIIGVQSSESSVIATAWKAGVTRIMSDVPHGKARSIADSINADDPRDPIRAVRAATETNGAYVVVSDEEIQQALLKLASSTGVWTEPAGACAWAGFCKARLDGTLRSDESTVVILTGSGLKDVR